MQIDPALQTKIGALVNQPWARDGRHCWKLCREVVGLLGVELPPVIDMAPPGKEGRLIKAQLFNDHPERAKWVTVERPETWAVALMHRTFRHPDMIEHSGVYFAIDGGRVLHTSDPHGVVWDSLPELLMRNWRPVFVVPRGAPA